MWNRLILAKELLKEGGSVFVQISDENVHHIKEILDEVFGAQNFCGLIAFQKTGGFSPKLLSSVYDFLVWYAKNKKEVKYRKLYRRRPTSMIKFGYTWIELPSGERRRLTSEEMKGVKPLPQGRRFQTSILVSAGASEEGSAPFEFQGREFRPAHGTHWKTSHDGLKELSERAFDGS